MSGCRSIARVWSGPERRCAGVSRSTNSVSITCRFCAGRCRWKRRQPVSDEPVLPELPVKVIVERFALQELALGEPMLGTAAGSRRKVRRSRQPVRRAQVRLRGAAPRCAGPPSINLDYVPQTNRLALELAHQDLPAALRPGCSTCPELPPVDLRLAG